MIRKGGIRMSVDVYLTFNGNAREAAEFYAQVFGTEKPKIMTFAEAPQNPDYPLPETAKNLVMHTMLSISGSRVMFSDTFPGSDFILGNNISLAFISKDLDEIQSTFNKLKEGGKVSMELEETFWSKCYGQLTDRFGINWMVSHESDEMAH
jgi:PhnB protein